MHSLNQPLPTVVESLTNPPPPSMSRILTTPHHCNPTMRAGIELAGFLNGSAWSAVSKFRFVQSKRDGVETSICVGVCATSGAHKMIIVFFALSHPWPQKLQH